MSGGKTAALLAGLLVLADAAYVHPRYGGYLAWMLGGLLARKEANQLQGQLGAVSSALSIYYGDKEGRYPEDLEAFLKDPRYSSMPRLPHADQFVLMDEHMKTDRPHWHKDTAKLRYLPSVDAADDLGGWGYVKDPDSPDYGDFFVNCTHADMRTGLPWNRIRPDTPQTWVGYLPPAPRRAPAAKPAPGPLETVVGEVYESGREERKLQDAEVAFTSSSGAVTRALTDTQGRYSIRLAPGRYHFLVRHSDYEPFDSGNNRSLIQSGGHNGASFGLDPRK